MTHNFRAQAKAALKRANEEIATGVDERLRYAALELRLCIEAITYDRAQGYAELLSPDAYRTWQPQKLMEALIQIEPRANQGPSVHFLDESNADGEPPTWVSLGQETVFTLKNIRAEYHALGSFVHYPNLENATTSGPSFEKMRARCPQIAAKLADVLGSPVFNAVLQNVVEIPCDNCDATILKHIPWGVQEVEAACFNCKAEYKISAQGNGEYSSYRLGKNVPCQVDGCGALIAIPREDLKDGGKASCPKCKSIFVITQVYRLTSQTT
ncbi:hypothetical protein [Comamonas aquatica]|uniref:hypothetical protein n=1 Tax=Comamonas aquatica TaxID=225991 RepID=UPI00244C337D|nr:hypothetical protein [Comamonas aquatica]MDH0494235.1 hypothetical protein [Comamonas aquatica]